MAKIGNEAKLILTLAKERMANKYDDIDIGNSRDFLSGYKQCLQDFVVTLDNVVLELESK